MKSPEYELKTAIYARLTDATLGINKEYTVVESADKDQEYPFIELGEGFQADDSTKSGPGNIFTISIHLWVRSNSCKHTDDMSNVILASLTTSMDTTPNHITLTNYNVTRQDHVSYRSLKDRDKISEIRHGIMDWEFWLEEK